MCMRLDVIPQREGQTDRNGKTIPRRQHADARFKLLIVSTIDAKTAIISTTAALLFDVFNLQLYLHQIASRSSCAKSVFCIAITCIYIYRERERDLAMTFLYTSVHPSIQCWYIVSKQLYIWSNFSIVCFRAIIPFGGQTWRYKIPSGRSTQGVRKLPFISETVRDTPKS